MIPKVSVIMITYNHERYIQEAVTSIVSQKTSFKFELIIGEDQSTDKTRAICDQLAEQYSDIVKLLPSDQRYGIMPNFFRTYNQGQGEYVATCEGDDFWTDEYKLQKQYDFMINNLDYSYCFHDCDLVDENGKLKRKNISRANDFGKQDFTREETILLPYFTNTLTLFFRKISLPNWMLELKMGDKPILKTLGVYGKGKYIPNAMGCYRIHAGGITSTDKRFSSKQSIHYITDNIFILKNLLLLNSVDQDLVMVINKEINRLELNSKFVRLQSTFFSRFRDIIKYRSQLNEHKKLNLATYLHLLFAKGFMNRVVVYISKHLG